MEISHVFKYHKAFVVLLSIGLTRPYIEGLILKIDDLTDPVIDLSLFFYFCYIFKDQSWPYVEKSSNWMTYLPLNEFKNRNKGFVFIEKYIIKTGADR